MSEDKNKVETGYVPIPNNVTKGEVLKTIFPDLRIIENSSGFVTFSFDGIVGSSVEESWWNAPYDYTVSLSLNAPDPVLARWLNVGTITRACSHCQHLYSDAPVGKWNYCPNCGVKMVD